MTRGTWVTANARGAQLSCSGQLVPDVGGHRQVVAQLEEQDNGRRLWSMSEANQVRTIGCRGGELRTRRKESERGWTARRVLPVMYDGSTNEARMHAPTQNTTMKMNSGIVHLSSLSTFSIPPAGAATSVITT